MSSQNLTLSNYRVNLPASNVTLPKSDMKLDLNEAFPYSDLDFFDFIKPDFSLTAKYNLISQIPIIKLCLI